MAKKSNDQLLAGATSKSSGKLDHGSLGGEPKKAKPYRRDDPGYFDPAQDGLRAPSGQTPYD